MPVNRPMHAVDGNGPVASTSRHRLDSPSMSEEPEEGDMIIEEDDSQDESGREDDFVVEEEDSEEDAAKPPRKKSGMSQKLGNRRAGAGVAVSGKRFTSQRKRTWCCARCEEAYTRDSHLARHLIRLHLDKSERAKLLARLACGVCGAAANRPDALKKHHTKHHANDPPPDWEDLKVWFDRFSEIVLQRNNRELHKTANTSQKERDLQLPFAHEKTPWTSYWPREEKDGSDEEDETADRQWEYEEDDAYRALAKPYGESSVARPLSKDFLPAPADLDGAEYVFEEAGHQRDSFADVDDLPEIEEEDDVPRKRRRKKEPRMISDHESDRSDSEKRKKKVSKPRKSSKKAVPAAGPVEIISLVLVDSRSGRGMRLRTGKTVALKGMIDVFATQANVDRSSLTLYFKGQPVDHKRTPAEAGINDNELLWYDVSLTSTGDVIVA